MDSLLQESLGLPAVTHTVDKKAIPDEQRLTTSVNYTDRLLSQVDKVIAHAVRQLKSGESTDIGGAIMRPVELGDDPTDEEKAQAEFQYRTEATQQAVMFVASNANVLADISYFTSEHIYDLNDPNIHMSIVGDLVQGVFTDVQGMTPYLNKLMKPIENVISDAVNATAEKQPVHMAFKLIATLHAFHGRRLNGSFGPLLVYVGTMVSTGDWRKVASGKGSSKDGDNSQVKLVHHVSTYTLDLDMMTRVFCGDELADAAERFVMQLNKYGRISVGELQDAALRNTD